LGNGESRHAPVLLKETIEMIGVRGEGTYCDATLGGGGFAQQFIDRLTTGKLIGLDRDRSAVEQLRERWRGDGRVILAHTNFSRIAEVWSDGKLPPPDAIVYDLGMSSIQLDDARRGLSFQADAPLDMRLDPEEAAPTAAEIVNTSDERELELLFREHGEFAARPIARRIVRERAVAPIETTGRLAAIVAGVVKKKARDIRRQECSSL
jgi:16S rRNA (cytosine1402-N4)-methyltransferase